MKPCPHNPGGQTLSYPTPKVGRRYARQSGKPVTIVAVGPFNAVGKTEGGKYLLFGLDGHGVGATGNLIEELDKTQS